MTYLIAALLGVIQGLTEFLPVSSTAHLLVAARVLGYEDPGGVFTVMIQLGSMLAIMWLYRVKLANVVRGLPSDRDAQRFVLMLLVERFGPAPVVLDADRTSLPRAFGVGLCQVLSLVPGVSRSGATIVGGMLMRLDRSAAAEFSFFLAIPTMVAAFVYELVQVRVHLETGRAAEIAIGFVMAFAASAMVVKPFLYFVRRAGFAPFAWYRVAFGVGLLAMVRGG